MPRAVGLREVARLARVSTTTVSKILNTPAQAARFSPSCVQRVRRAAQRLNYRCNYHARTLQAGRAYDLGFVVDVRAGRSLLASRYWALLLSGVEAAAHAAGYALTLIGPTRGQSSLTAAFEALSERRIDGLVVPGQIPEDQWRRPAAAAEGPVVIAGGGRRPRGVPLVRLDDGAGVHLALEHLAHLGHRRILWVGDDADEPTRRRRDFFLPIARQLGLRPRACVYPLARKWRSEEDRIKEARTAQSHSLPPAKQYTAIVRYNDIAACALYGVLAQRGVRVPQEVSVVGFDDFFAAELYPGLTTVSHQCPQMGAQAVGILLEMIEDPGARGRLRNHGRIVAPELIVRQSTAQCRGR